MQAVLKIDYSVLIYFNDNVLNDIVESESYTQPSGNATNSNHQGIGDIKITFQSTEGKTYDCLSSMEGQCHHC